MLPWRTKGQTHKGSRASSTKTIDFNGTGPNAILETITVEEVTTILQEEVQTIPVLQNVSVSVTNKNVQEVQITVTSTADTAAADVNTLAVMSGLLAILFPVSMFGIWWRCQKRLRPDSHIPGDHAPKPKPREDEDEPRSDESDDSESAQSFFTAESRLKWYNT
eukprot:g33758.t1